MIAVLGGLADVERDLIRTRTAEGRSRAKARGQHMGRPPQAEPRPANGGASAPADGATLKELAKSYKPLGCDNNKVKSLNYGKA
jgi:DNA invertase Pin-like site-specific DNA recombinase